MKFFFLIFLLSLALFAISIGKVPKNVLINNDDGGIIGHNHIHNCKEWIRCAVHGKVIVLFYVDPDKHHVNEHFAKILKKQHYNQNLLKSIAIINVAATWAPDILIESKLEEKQDEYPTTVYVKDKNKILVKEWDLRDNCSNVLIFSPSAKLLFLKSGTMTNKDISKALRIIKENLNE